MVFNFEQGKKRSVARRHEGVVVAAWRYKIPEEPA
jgi:hypothetical protein